MNYLNGLSRKEKVELLRTAYKPGRRIRLIRMEGEDQMPYGLEGEITHVDDAGQIHVKWDNGSTLALQEHDSFSVIS